LHSAVKEAYIRRSNDPRGRERGRRRSWGSANAALATAVVLSLVAVMVSRPERSTTALAAAVLLLAAVAGLEATARVADQHLVREL
jgi:hypothetical protein